MKTIKITHIDTAGHGFYSVSKKDFLKVGGDPDKISQSSGHTFSRMYLEEDGDAYYFFNIAKANGFEIVVKSSYNPSFSITHNYKPELFNYTPKTSQIIYLADGMLYLVSEIRPNGKMIVQNLKSRMQYGIGKHNPFQYITGLQAI